MHEDLKRTHAPAEGGSNRSFGFVFCGFFAILAILNGWRDGTLWPYFVAIAGLFLLTALVAPRALAPLNRLWFRFGMLLHRIVNPVVMGFLFYGTVTPIALVMRLVGKDPLNRAFDPKARTYWIERSPPGPTPETMRQQF